MMTKLIWKIYMINIFRIEILFFLLKYFFGCDSSTCLRVDIYKSKLNLLRRDCFWTRFNKVSMNCSFLVWIDICLNTVSP